MTARFDYADLGSDIESVHIETSDGTTFDVNFAEASTEVIGTYTEQFELSTAASGPRTVDICSKKQA